MWIVIGVLFSILLGFWVAGLQNSEISRCLKTKRLHDDLLTGKTEMRYLSDSQLLSLSRPKFTHVGVGGFGPYYNPSFLMYEMVTDELSRRRSNRVAV